MPVFAYLLIFIAGQAFAAKTLTSSNCAAMLQSLGMVTDVKEYAKTLQDQQKFMKELMKHEKETGRAVSVIFDPDVIHHLKQSHGPVISLVTYSRELSPTENVQVATHLNGLFSTIPSGRAIIASGGTMGDRGVATSYGGGVGMAHPMAMNMGFEVLSFTSAAGYKYKAAPANYVFASTGKFGSESQVMLKHSDSMVMLGGGGQAMTEAKQYLNYNTDGLLVVIDDPAVGGSAQALRDDALFQNLVSNYPDRIKVVRSGSEAAVLINSRFKLENNVGAQLRKLAEHGHNEMNIFSPNFDIDSLGQNARVVAFSGWSNFSKTSVDLVEKSAEVQARTEKALAHLNEALLGARNNMFYATAGNDPDFKGQIPAFESMVHNLDTREKVKYLAVTAEQMKLEELNPKVKAISYVSKDWTQRTQQVVSKSHAFVTSGGNVTVIDQARVAAAAGKPHIHILGANSLSDLAIIDLKKKNKNLHTLTPEELLALPPHRIREMLGCLPDL
jgi:hypothetical protein